MLAAAALHASWNALVKQGGDPYLRIAVVNLTGTLLVLPLVLTLPPPPAAAWPWLLGSVVAHTGYYWTLARAYSKGDLSLVYPVARGLAPPMVAVGGGVLAGELPGPAGAAAIALVAAGIASLALAGGGLRARLPALASAAACAATIALYTLCDGLGGRASDGVLRYIAWLFLIEALPFGLWVAWRRREELATGAWRRLAPAALGGVLATLAYGIVIWAMSLAPMAYVSAVRETGVLLAALIGVRLLGEPFGASRLVSASVVLAGLVLLRLGG